MNTEKIKNEVRHYSIGRCHTNYCYYGGLLKDEIKKRILELIPTKRIKSFNIDKCAKWWNSFDGLYNKHIHTTVKGLIKEMKIEKCMVHQNSFDEDIKLLIRKRVKELVSKFNIKQCARYEKQFDDEIGHSIKERVLELSSVLSEKDCNFYMYFWMNDKKIYDALNERGNHLFNRK